MADELPPACIEASWKNGSCACKMEGGLKKAPPDPLPPEAVPKRLDRLLIPGRPPLLPGISCKICKSSSFESLLAAFAPPENQQITHFNDA